MKWMLLIAIRLYWWLWRPHRRRSCLFCVSCSQQVYQRTAQSGFLAGLRKLRQRSSRCKPGYRISISSTGETSIALVDGSILREDEIAPTILSQAKDTAGRLQLDLTSAIAKVL